MNTPNGQKTASSSFGISVPWYIYFAGGALAGWLAKGRFTWIAGAAAAAYYVNKEAEKKRVKVERNRQQMAAKVAQKGLEPMPPKTAKSKPLKRTSDIESADFSVKGWKGNILDSTLGPDDMDGPT
jgi:hypothetical protein